MEELSNSKVDVPATDNQGTEENVKNISSTQSTQTQMDGTCNENQVIASGSVNKNNQYDDPTICGDDDCILIEYEIPVIVVEDDEITEKSSKEETALPCMCAIKYKSTVEQKLELELKELKERLSTRMKNRRPLILNIEALERRLSEPHICENHQALSITPKLNNIDNSTRHTQSYKIPRGTRSCLCDKNKNENCLQIAENGYKEINGLERKYQEIFVAQLLQELNKPALPINKHCKCTQIKKMQCNFLVKRPITIIENQLGNINRLLKHKCINSSSLHDLEYGKLVYQRNELRHRLHDLHHLQLSPIQCSSCRGTNVGTENATTTLTAHNNANIHINKNVSGNNGLKNNEKQIEPSTMYSKLSEDLYIMDDCIRQEEKAITLNVAGRTHFPETVCETSHFDVKCLPQPNAILHTKIAENMVSKLVSKVLPCEKNETVIPHKVLNKSESIGIDLIESKSSTIVTSLQAAESSCGRPSTPSKTVIKCWRRYGMGIIEKVEDIGERSQGTKRHLDSSEDIEPQTMDLQTALNTIQPDAFSHQNDGIKRPKMNHDEGNTRSTVREFTEWSEKYDRWAATRRIEK